MTETVGIVDYGVGNLFSLKSSLAAIGANTVTSCDADALSKTDRLVLPGVGAFEDAVRKLKERSLFDFVKNEAHSGKPLLGICLGMQMLLERSYEYGVHEGLSLIKGEVRPIAETADSKLKIPHIGWNALDFCGKRSRIFKYINDGDFVYFVHSYHAVNCGESVTATTDYSVPLCAAVESENVFGCQFHPEKSGRVGLSILKAFCEI